MLSNISDFTLPFDDFFSFLNDTIVISSHVRRLTEETLTGKRNVCQVTISRVISRIIPSRISPYDLTSYSYNCNQQSCKAFHGGNTDWQKKGSAWPALNTSRAAVCTLHCCPASAPYDYIPTTT